jgi:3-oxoacyl-[acyl-carrier protein] reductase
MDFGIAGRTALVTGASRGLGAGIARALAAEGARVAVAARSRERIESLAEELGGRSYVHDNLDLDAAPRLIDRVEADLGPLDILVPNTGGPPANPDALGSTRAQWEDAYRTLVLAPMALIERAVPGMRERGFGRIVCVSSSSVREPIHNLMLSNSHRAATLAAFKTLARQLAGDGITLNTLLTGRVATDRIAELWGSMEEAQRVASQEIPAGRLGTVEEYGAVAAFLCSEQASYVTGTAIPVDGGAMRSV